MRAAFTAASWPLARPSSRMLWLRQLYVCTCGPPVRPRRENSASAAARHRRESHRESSWCRARTCAAPATAMRQSMRDSLRPRSARVPRKSSFRKLTRSRAISTASRSLDAPRDVLASWRRRGSSQNTLRTFPIRVARGLDVVTRDRDERRQVFESRRLDDVATDPR